MRAVSRFANLKRSLRKARRIGVFGTLHGLRVRRWLGPALNARLRATDIVEVCASQRVPLVEIQSFSDSQAQERVRALGLDLAISMGNGYIPRSFFEIPRWGMINVHHELLPAYRGAQTALWQIHDGSSVTGFTIHEIDDRLDAGRILLREATPLIIRRTLRETIIDTAAVVQKRSLDCLLNMLPAFADYRDHATPNCGGRWYTTPHTRALWRIYRHFRVLQRTLARSESLPSSS